MRRLSDVLLLTAFSIGLCGSASFAAESLPAGSVTAVGDFNNDGRPDLIGVIGNASAAELSVLINAGAGVFTRGNAARLPLGANSFVYSVC